MTTPAQRAAFACRKLTEFRSPSAHHIVSVDTSDHARAKETAHRHGARLVTGTARHVVAHFDDKARSQAFHREMAAGGHKATHQTVREGPAS